MNQSTRVVATAAVIEAVSLCKRYGDRLEGAKLDLSAEISQISDTRGLNGVVNILIYPDGIRSTGCLFFICFRNYSNRANARFYL